MRGGYRHPLGAWGLLVALPEQPWGVPRNELRLVGPAGGYRQSAGVRVIVAGYDDTSNATDFLCLEGEEVLAKFESPGLGGDVVNEYSSGDPDSWQQSLLTGTRLPKDWIEEFESPAEVVDALAKEFDAFIPYINARTALRVTSPSMASTAGSSNARIICEST